MNRRTFINKVMLRWTGILSSLGFISSCGKVIETDEYKFGSCITKDIIPAIRSNHGHTLTISHADVVLGIQKVYDITGSAGHSHSVTITPADFTSLISNKSVSTLSSNVGHDHIIDCICV